MVFQIDDEIVLQKISSDVISVTSSKLRQRKMSPNYVTNFFHFGSLPNKISVYANNVLTK